MSWLRIDDGFAQHPKIVQLAPRDRWTWLEILCYCARYQTKGELPLSVKEVVRGATPAFLRRCHALQLLDQEHDHYSIHDWHDYNGKDAKIVVKERVRQHRERNAQVTPNPDEEALPNRYSHAGARARSRPVPSLVKEPFVRSNGTGTPDTTNERPRNFFDDSHLDADAELDRLRSEGE